MAWRGVATDAKLVAEVDHGCQVLDRLADGAHSVVYRALDPIRGRVVALKLTRDVTVAAPRLHLLHPHLLETLRAGRGYAVMELAAGGRSDDFLARRFGLGPSAERTRAVCRIGYGAAEALARLSADDLVHRDVKPANLLIQIDSRDPGAFVVKLADFDLVTSRGTTTTGILQGTPGYAAPEQMAGDRIDGRADLYALGATLAELASGRERQVEARRARPVAVRELRALPEPLRSILEGLLQTAPAERRPATARALADVLAPLAGVDHVGPFVAPEIVERDAVLAHIAGAIRPADGGRALLVVGPRGVGRTALLGAARSYAEASGVAVHERLERVPREPGLWLVDDLDRSPPRERDLVVAAARALCFRIAGTRGATLIASAASDTSDGIALTERLVALGVERVDLAPLDAAGVGRLLATRTLLPPSADLVDRVYRASGGLVALIEPLLAGREPTAALADVVARLEAPQLHALKALALCRSPVRADRLPVDATAIDSLWKRSLVRREGDDVAVRSGQIAALVREATTPEDRRQLAASLARSLRPRSGSCLSIALALASAELNGIARSLGDLGERQELAGEPFDQLDVLDAAAATPGLPAALVGRIDLFRARCQLLRGDLGEASRLALESLESGTGDVVGASAALLAAGVARSRGDLAEHRRLSRLAAGRAIRSGRVDHRTMALIELGRAQQAVAIARAAGDRRAEALAQLAIGDEALGGGRAAAAGRAYRGAFRAATGVDDTLTARAQGRLGNLAYRRGQFGRARGHWQRAKAAMPRLTPTQRIVSEHRFGLASMDGERYDEALVHFRACERLCRDGGDLERLTISLNEVLTAETNRLEVEAAFAAGAEALEIATRLSDVRGEVIVRVNLAHLALLVGDDAEVTKQADAIERRASQLEDPQLLVIALRDRASLWARRGVTRSASRRRAAALLEDAAGRLRAAPVGEAALRVELDRCLLEASPTAATLERARLVFAHARSNGMRALHRLAEAGVAAIAARSGALTVARRRSALAVRHARRSPLSETSLLAYAARAAATSRLQDHAAYAAALDGMAERLGPTFRASFLARADLGLPLLTAVSAAISVDLTLAQSLAQSLAGCPALRWQADAMIARSAAARGLVGIGIFRANRALETLRQEPRLEEDAALEPATRELLSVLSKIVCF